MLNRAVLTGRLTKDPELRSTGSGTKVCSFTLAVDRQFRNQDGKRDADFIQCVIWRKSAENFVKFTHKGSLVGIDGRIQTRNYENNQGNRIYVTEIVVDNFALLDSRHDKQGNDQEQAPLPPEPSANESEASDKLPF
jgi:single-strand DNA-binding protein